MAADTDLSDFPVHLPTDTRWADNDMFGHLNNAVYFELFDTAINRWIAEATGTGPLEQPARGVVAESSCRFLSEVGFPSSVVVGLGIERLGSKSVTYSLGLFRQTMPSELGEGDADAVLAALGRWVHVYVDPVSRQTVPIPSAIRAALEQLTPHA